MTAIVPSIGSRKKKMVRRFILNIGVPSVAKALQQHH
jgi:hypothetical protein